MRIETDPKLDFSDVLLRPKRSTLGSRSEVSLERTFSFRNYQPYDMDIEHLRPEGGNYTGIPIMASNMDGVGTFEMADSLGKLGLFTCLVKTYTIPELVDWFNEKPSRAAHTAMSIGITDKDFYKLQNVLAGANVKYICIDVANGYSVRFTEYIKMVRGLYPHIVIIAGNVVTADQTQELILNGADIVKVGIGPGSVCTTRIKTGVGYPQLSAVIECADAAHGLGGHIIADGGCACPGDVAKAFAGGADYVMLGGMLAGHIQGGGTSIVKRYQTNEIIVDEENGTAQLRVEEKQFVLFYGMSSDAANKKHFGGLKEYRASEGREALVPYRGDVSNTVSDILGGVRSACTYVGAQELKHINKCATFVMANSQYNKTYESTTLKI